MANPVEDWKSQKHAFDVWPDVETYAANNTPMNLIDSPDLERMKWHGFFYRKRDEPARYMNRIRLTANELTAEQAKEIALMAYEYGHGIVDITTRANLQVQGLEISHLPKVAQRLEKVGLTSKQTGHDNIRNVFGHPLSGVWPGEILDTRALCREVDRVFVGSREYSDLPRKMNICFNGSEEHPAHFWTQDISFLAAYDDDGDPAFHVLLAGTQGQNPRLAWYLPVLVKPEQCAPLVKSLLDLFRKKGSREKRNKARLRFLVEEIGIPAVREWLDETLPFRLQPAIREPIPTVSAEHIVGWIRQNDPKLWSMGISVPLGRMTWQQLEGLALISKRWGNGQLRTTPEQGIAVINIPTGFKSAAATDAAALGLSLHADDLELNTVACTGNQFCNIAVTETKGQMLQLIEKLRKRALKLHEIRIHMSGCPSSCAQHFTADIGLKGVRVRRLIGTREGFDVFLGGGIAGQVHMGLPYRLGVDADQLPNLIEEVTQEYYLRHKPGQTFSGYWRERLQAADAQKVQDDDYQLPTWICEGCQHVHTGEDPPIFCPSCAGLRRRFARLDEEVLAAQPFQAKGRENESVPQRTDGFQFAAKRDSLSASEGLTVEVAGREYALFLVDGEVKCIDSECPHEGATLADGEFQDGVITCAWHRWTFDVCNGCSLDPPGNEVTSYPTWTEEGNIFIQLGKAPAAAPPMKKSPRPLEAELPVLEVIEETPDVRTFRLDNREAKLPFDFPGKFAKVCLSADGGDVWRSFTISSSPTIADSLDLTIKRNPSGVVSNHLFAHAMPGTQLKLKGSQGGFFFDPAKHREPLVLISAGSGITPMMSIARFLAARRLETPCTFLFGSRSEQDIIFHEECQKLAAEKPWFRYFVTLSQPSDDWSGRTGRLSAEHLSQCVEDIPNARYFLCGPNEFMDSFRAELTRAGVPEDRIHTEQFHAGKTAVAT